MATIRVILQGIEERLTALEQARTETAAALVAAAEVAAAATRAHETRHEQHEAAHEHQAARHAATHDDQARALADLETREGRRDALRDATQESLGQDVGGLLEQVAAHATQAAATQQQADTLAAALADALAAVDTERAAREALAGELRAAQQAHEATAAAALLAHDAAGHTAYPLPVALDRRVAAWLGGASTGATSGDATDGRLDGRIDEGAFGCPPGGGGHDWLPALARAVGGELEVLDVCAMAKDGGCQAVRTRRWRPVDALGNGPGDGAAR